MPKQIDYKAGWSGTMRDLRGTFEKWGVREWGAESPAQQWGAYDRALDKEKRIVTLRFTQKDGQAITLRSDFQSTPAGNLRVLWYAVEAMRMNEVRGLTEIMQQAYAQLSAPAVQRDPFEVLGVRPDADWEIITAAYRAAAKKAHPDIEGGSDERMAEINAAMERISEDRKVTA